MHMTIYMYKKRVFLVHWEKSKSYGVLTGQPFGQITK